MRELELTIGNYISQTYQWYYSYLDNLVQNVVPIANNDQAVTGEDTPIVINVLDNDLDVDGDPLTIVAATNGLNGSVQIVGDKLVYTPDVNFWGVDNFTYTITDGSGGVSTAIVSVDVSPINDDPEANEDNAVSFGGAVTIDVLANDYDPDGDAIQLVSVNNGSNGVVFIDNGKVVYTPNDGFLGVDDFTYVISDGNGGTSQGTAFVEVKAPQDWKIDMRSYDVLGVAGHTYLQFWDPNGNLVAEISAGPENTPRRIVDIDYEVTPGTSDNRNDETDPFALLFSGSADEFNAILEHAIEAAIYINEQQLPYFALPLDPDGAYYNSNSAANTILSAMLETGFVSETDVDNAKAFHNGLYQIGTPGKDKDMFQGDDWSANMGDGGSVIGSVVSLTDESKKIFLKGADGDDVLTGNNENNYLFGNEGNDVLIGLQGSDYLDGGNGEDVLLGGLGNDYLAGRDGSDIILGGFGADVILGGDDSDNLSGGFGNDRFVYSNLGESIATGRDVITDFMQGSDVLDFVSLAFFGINAFADVAVTNDGVNTFVSDNNSDFEIELSGVIALNDSDFSWG